MEVLIQTLVDGLDTHQPARCRDDAAHETGEMKILRKGNSDDSAQ